jgi:predicted DNA-binding protein (MmcQ/YjbR family)
MVHIKIFRQIALSFPEATEALHFEKISFRIGKKIFATCDNKNKQACIKLSAKDQDVFSAFDKSIIFPVPNKWGSQGWTFVNLAKVNKQMFTAALTTAYCEVAPKKLSTIVKTKLQ